MRCQAVVFLMVMFMCCMISKATPYADSVVNFSQGFGAEPNYNDPSVVLGAPPAEDSYEGYTWPISITSAPYKETDVVSLGNGGSITIAFDHQVMNNPLDVEYGTDLLVFGNSFFACDYENEGRIAGAFFEPAKIEVSQDGVLFYEIADTYADALYPYTASAGNFFHATPADVPYMNRLPGEVEADFLGGCGGAQVDISNAIGLSEPLDWIMYVRVTDIADDSGIADVAGFADVVPEPATIFAMLAGAVFLRRRKAEI
ncbi:MAG: PEP-CTERM sorting domain-containing protein [Sedimentisphaerales bacterium]|nr:PEP-CTERM sorting domain-containing protein [Sedimentisphaerales bacterium]